MEPTGKNYIWPHTYTNSHAHGHAANTQMSSFQVGAILGLSELQGIKGLKTPNKTLIRVHLANVYLQNIVYVILLQILVFFVCVCCCFFYQILEKAILVCVKSALLS